MKKKVLIGVGVVLVLIQFIRPAKNISDDRTQDISNNYLIPVKVNTTLQAACNDCHTNKTRYPWYSEIQPFSWWMNGHVTDGKRHLNFSTYTKLPIAVQNHKFEEIIDMVKDGEMPLSSYTYLGMHSDADLSNEQRQLIMDWAKRQMDTLKSQYPPDSLVMKRRAPPSK